MSNKIAINMEYLPRHVAIIMDGNGRWAKSKGKARVFGHTQGVKAVREITETAAELGVEYLTLYAFSTENWNRPRLEVEALMALLVDTMRKEIDSLDKNNIRVQSIGDLSQLPSRTRKALQEGIEKTKNNTRMTLVLALNYSSKWEITRAAQILAQKAQSNEIQPKDIDEAMFESALNTAGMPHPELLIRTSGETRLSNFLLWQLAYAEFYFTPVLWPDFGREDFYAALLDYQRRERRFGMISEQIK